MKILSKRYKEALSKIEKGKVYDKEEALKLLKETSTTKFDSTVEVSVRLNLDKYTFLFTFGKRSKDLRSPNWRFLTIFTYSFVFGAAL